MLYVVKMTGVFDLGECGTEVSFTKPCDARNYADEVIDDWGVVEVDKPDRVGHWHLTIDEDSFVEIQKRNGKA